MPTEAEKVASFRAGWRMAISVGIDPNNKKFQTIVDAILEAAEKVRGEEKTELRDALLIIAERMEELTADVARDGFDANELLDAAIETGKKARAAAGSR